MPDVEKQPLTSRSSYRNEGGCCWCCPTCRCDWRGFFLRNVAVIARLCGLAVVTVLWAATVTSLEGKTDAPTYVGYYLLVTSIVITFLEITWILDKMACCIRRGCCCRCWSVILWLDGWRKFILYVLATVPLFLQGLNGLIDVVSGFCLLFLACLYLVKSFVGTTNAFPINDHEPIPESKSVGKLPRHETSTQTDVISETTEPNKVAEPKGLPAPKSVPEPKPEPTPANPFDTEESDIEKSDNVEEADKTQKLEQETKNNYEKTEN